MSELDSHPTTRVFGFTVDKSISVLGLVQLIVIVGGLVLGGFKIYQNFSLQLSTLDRGQGEIAHDLSEAIAAFSAGSSGMSERISEVEKRVSAQEAQLGIQGANVGHIQGQMSALSAQIGNLDTFIRSFANKER